MKHLLTLSAIVMLSVITSVAQKPKDTFDHEKFAKKVVLYIGIDVTAMSPKDNDLKYISTATGKTFDELRTQNDANKKTLLEDADFLKKNGIGVILDRTELSVTQETPIKKADMTLYCHYKDKSYTLRLTNCVQTNVTWFLGDGMKAEGAGISELSSAKKEKDAKMANSFFGKMAAAGAEQQKKDEVNRKRNDSIQAANAEYRKGIKGYQAKLFPPQGTMVTDEYTSYIHTDLYNKALPGYYIDVTGKKVDDSIKYWEPYTLLTMGPTPSNLMAAAKVPFKDINAFYLGDQLFVKNQNGIHHWAIIVGEGAIRQLVDINKATMGGKDVYTVTHLVQKLDGKADTRSSINSSFKDRMSEYVKDNTVLAEKIKRGDVNYQAADLSRIITDYNMWYDKQFPGKVAYIFEAKQK